ncbi:hypothetical protein AZA_84599 [Nitrospirillum viridazoti Y2]|nr:hypothetical protein AZA_84599 [Nitrospirillum amazonense Y2]
MGAQSPQQRAANAEGDHAQEAIHRHIDRHVEEEQVQACQGPPRCVPSLGAGQEVLMNAPGASKADDALKDEKRSHSVRDDFSHGRTISAAISYKSGR